MKYMGGKYFLKKELSEVMKKYIPPEKCSGYLEPFCGSLNVALMMSQDYECHASDYHPDLIQLWKEVQLGKFIFPTEMNEEIYLETKELVSPNALKGFVGFSMSFGGKFYSGYADKYKNNKKENFLKEGINSIRKIENKIKDIKFDCCLYDTLKPVGKLIYCDPPYKVTKNPVKYRTGTKIYDKFDNEHFWDIMREWSKNNFVFISETTAPQDFISIWSKKAHRSASQSSKTRYKNESESFQVEKLYVHEELYKKLKAND